MKNEREMYNPMIPNMMGPNMMGNPNQFPGYYYPGMGVDQTMENRISAMERQIKRLDARVTRLENQYQQPVPMPYQAPQMTGQPTEQYNPYQTSMQSF